MFESTEWSLIEPSSEDTNKYDNLCPTIVTWTSKEVLPDSKVCKICHVAYNMKLSGILI